MTDNLVRIAKEENELMIFKELSFLDFILVPMRNSTRDRSTRKLFDSMTPMQFYEFIEENPKDPRPLHYLNLLGDTERAIELANFLYDRGIGRSPGK